MIRIPLSKFNIPLDQDKDVLKTYNWLMTLISKEDWLVRKTDIEKRITIENKTSTPFSDPLDKGTLLVIKDDQIGWYLYLAETFLKEPQKYESIQGSRVIPIFKRLGIDFDLLMTIEGVEQKIKVLLKKRRAEADAILFEILTALTWARNGWFVKFLEEGKGGKSPDLLVAKGKRKYQVECKRQMKTAAYTYEETRKRQVMLSHLNRELLFGNFLLDITFHVELHTLADTYLKDLLSSKLSGFKVPGKISDPNIADIVVAFVDIKKINKHLQSYYVKYPSPQLNLLIGEKAADNYAFTSGMYANFLYLGDGVVNNQYVHQLANAYGVFIKCDAPEAINAKARDIKKQLFSALEQFSGADGGVIHIGMETFDGPEVEKERFLKISDTLKNTGVMAKKLKWAYLHFFQSYSTPIETWAFDETVSTIFQHPIDGDPPLTANFLVVPDGAAIENLSHWERPLPE